LFGERPVGAVTLVEPPLSTAYARKARVAFFVVGSVAGAVAATVSSLFMAVPVAVILGAALGAVCGLAAGMVVRAWPVVRWLWWWAAEIGAAGLLLFGLPALGEATHPLGVLALTLAAAGVVGLVRPVRRRVVAWAWCVVVRHRLRLAFAEFIRATNRTQPGGLPLILWARPTLAGERVWVWLRPGLALPDLEGKTAKLAVGCWASEVRVVRASTRYAALVRVDVTRRDPLTGTVASPLVGLIPRPRPSVVPVSPAVVPAALDLADVPEPVIEPAPRGRR